MTRYIGKYISISFNDRPTSIAGLVVDYNDDWTLLKYNAVDYVVDGYIIVRHKNTEGFQRSTEEKFREKVIRVKGLSVTEKDRIPLNNLDAILSFISKQHGLFAIYLKSEKACYVGKLASITGKELLIKSLTPKGKWSNQMKFRTGDIRTIEYDTDYLNSLKLLQQK